MSDGIIRAVDKMGRIVIPKEFRAKLGIKNEVDSFEIFLKGDSIVLKKHQPFCTFCNKVKPSVKIGDYYVCEDCIDMLNEAKKHIK